MAGVSIQVRLGGDKARQTLRYLLNLAEDPTPLMDILGTRLVTSTERRFDEQRGPAGTPWPQSRRARAQGGRTLYDKGLLYDSLTHQVRGRTQVEVGVDGASQSAKFAYVHQFGAVIVPRNATVLAFTGPDGHKVFAHTVTIPARPFLGINDQDREDVGEDWLEYVRRRLKA